MEKVLKQCLAWSKKKPRLNRFLNFPNWFFGLWHFPSIRSASIRSKVKTISQIPQNLPNDMKCWTTQVLHADAETVTSTRYLVLPISTRTNFVLKLSQMAAGLRSNRVCKESMNNEMGTGAYVSLTGSPALAVIERRNRSSWSTPTPAINLGVIVHRHASNLTHLNSPLRYVTLIDADECTSRFRELTGNLPLRLYKKRFVVRRGP